MTLVGISGLPKLCISGMREPRQRVTAKSGHRNGKAWDQVGW